MTNNTITIVGAAILLAASFGVNYLMALAGEPRAYWLMHSVFGLM